MRWNRPIGLCLGLLSLSLHAGPRATPSPEEGSRGTPGVGKDRATATWVSQRCGADCGCRWTHLAAAVWVGPDGYLLTKASEIPELEKARVQWSGTVRGTSRNSALTRARSRSSPGSRRERGGLHRL